MVVERTQGSRSTMYFAVGERRVRAHKLLKWPTITATVRRLRDDDEFDRVMRWYGIVENVGREDLNPIEQAHAFAELMESEGLTQGEVAELCHVQPMRVSVYIGLIMLDDSLQNLIAKRLAAMKKGDRMALKRALDDLNEAFHVLRRTIKEIRG